MGDHIDNPHTAFQPADPNGWSRTTEGNLMQRDRPRLRMERRRYRSFMPYAMTTWTIQPHAPGQPP